MLTQYSQMWLILVFVVWYSPIVFNFLVHENIDFIYSRYDNIFESCH